MAARIRMKRIGRKHRPFYRICAVDSRSPRDGKVIEELGTYDPMVPETDARCTMNGERIQYWLGVGALPSQSVSVLIKKYGPNGTHLAEVEKAKEQLAARKEVPPAPEPVSTRKKSKKQAEEAAADVAVAEAPAETAPEPAADAEAAE